MQSYLEMVYNETSRVSKTVSNLLAFSRKTNPEFKPVNINALIEETLSLTEYQMRLQGITIERQLNPNLMSVNADPGQLKQAFLNLILNAQDAMGAGGTLTLESKNHHNREVRISISDTGVGIPKDSFSHIFEPFYTTKKSGGVGLGLSVVYGIIRDHNGFYKSGKRRGARDHLFTFFCQPIKWEVRVLPRKKIKILVVDDELSIRESLSGWLQQDGFEVDSAADGNVALALIQENHYEIMLIDVKMPEMDGLTLLKKLKEKEPEIAVVMMTAHGAIQDAVDAMRLGAYDYLLKPFDLEELSLTIEKLVRLQTLAMENLILKDRMATMTRFENLVGQSPPMLRLV